MKPWTRLSNAGMGISTAIGIGGDPIIGTTTKEASRLNFLWMTQKQMVLL